MPEHKPLYLYSLKEAAEWNEKDEWRESYLENCDCARAIERAIDEHYDGQCLKSCAKEIIDRYGFDRVNFVLAATVRQGTHDGRYSEDNKKWARRFSVMDKENTWQYHVRSHPGLVNLFVADARRLWDMDTNRRLKDCMLFNIFSFMSNELLGKGNTAASVDELYLFLSNMTTIEYLRNCMKRVRKKDSSVILASQNIEDFLIPSIREFTKPLFSIPTHQFLFNAGQINPKEYMDALQVEPSEFELIKYPERGTCLYRCGNERYLLQVIAPDYKAAIFGKAGGR